MPTFPTPTASAILSGRSPAPTSQDLLNVTAKRAFGESLATKTSTNVF